MTFSSCRLLGSGWTRRCTPCPTSSTLRTSAASTTATAPSWSGSSSALSSAPSSTSKRVWVLYVLYSNKKIFFAYSLTYLLYISLYICFHNMWSKYISSLTFPIFLCTYATIIFNPFFLPLAPHYHSTLYYTSNPLSPCTDQTTKPIQTKLSLTILAATRTLRTAHGNRGLSRDHWREGDGQRNQPEVYEAVDGVSEDGGCEVFGPGWSDFS